MKAKGDGIFFGLANRFLNNVTIICHCGQKDRIVKLFMRHYINILLISICFDDCFEMLLFDH
jgi:hypothetical protein